MEVLVRPGHYPGTLLLLIPSIPYLPIPGIPTYLLVTTLPYSKYPMVGGIPPGR